MLMLLSLLLLLMLMLLPLILCCCHCFWCFWCCCSVNGNFNSFRPSLDGNLGTELTASIGVWHNIRSCQWSWNKTVEETEKHSSCSFRVERGREAWKTSFKGHSNRHEMFETQNSKVEGLLSKMKLKNVFTTFDMKHTFLPPLLHPII